MSLQVHLCRWEGRFSEEKERRYLACLPPALLPAIGRYRRWQDRQATLIGKLLLQRALRRLGAGGEPPGLESPGPERLGLERLERSETGKPFIAGGPAFNLSHSGELVALALVENGAAGIDVEKIRPIATEDFSRHLPEIAELSEAEALDEPERLKAFYACWTKKEAVLKGEGSGLLAPMEQVKLQGDAAYFRQGVWRLRRIDCGADYCCHVATSAAQTGCSVELVNF